MTAGWKDDRELFELAQKELFTAVVGDILDQMGLLHQFLPPRIKPLERGMRAIGRAMTVLEADYFQERGPADRNPLSARSFGLLFEALDDLKPQEVYVCAGGSPRYALWGGLMTTRALWLKAAGAVMDGFARDTLEILELGFPTFAHGSFAQDQGPRGKVVDWRVPIEIEAVRINPGDIVFGDLDGVLVIPREAEEEAFRRALEKARGERKVAQAIRGGMGAAEAWNKFGIM